MAYRGSFIPPNQPQGLSSYPSAGGGAGPFPFQVTNTSGAMVIVEPFSYLLDDFDIKTNIPICGLNYEFKLQYGEKIYLETVFDVNGQVAYARIDNEASWLIQTSGTGAGDSDSGGDLVYPSLMAVLDKDDAEFYTDYLTAQKTGLALQQQTDLAYWTDKMNDADPNSTAYKYASDTYNEHSTNYTNALAKLASLSSVSGQAIFFSNVTSIRREVSAYNMIAYTTKDPKAATDLNGMSITPPDSGTTPVTDDIMQNPSFYCVQTLNKDLMLMDVDFQRTACRYPMEFSRPVYFFKDPDTGLAEDDENVDDNSDNDSE